MKKDKEIVIVPAPKEMRPLPWPVHKSSHEYMKMRLTQNRASKVAAEEWMAGKIRAAGFKFHRQRQWGCRIFDFWNSKLGIAIEVDGPTHDEKHDAYRDEYNYRRSGIVVLRVKNYNEEDADAALAFVAKSHHWCVRRKRLGIRTGKKSPLLLGDNQPE